MSPNRGHTKPIKPVQRARLWYALLLLIMGIFLVRLFYLQVIRHDYYKSSADQKHLTEYAIAPERGLIKAHSGEGVVPLVLNQKFYLVTADPMAIKKDHQKIAIMLAGVLKQDAGEIERKLRTPKSQYAIIARKVTEEQRKEIVKHEYPGVRATPVPYRMYPNGTLAAQVLGFVNNDSKGVYGIEQALDSTLKGEPGLLKAVTDVHGVPLAAETDNILKSPKPGQDVVLTLDIAMQKQLEDLLKKGLDRARAEQGSVLVMDPNTGAIKAMANWPTYDPGNYGQVNDPSVFINGTVGTPLEVGSVMKPLTAAAALDKRAVAPDSTYYDPSKMKIDGYTVSNIEEDGGPGTKSVTDILDLSLNTGATWLLMRMGGSNDTITKQGREVWYDYMANHYMFGKKTGVEQGYEAEGLVPDPNKGFARNLTYANASFGQAMTATPLQMAAAFSAAVNGGTYYKPTLIDYVVDKSGKKTVQKPQVVNDDVVSSDVSRSLIPMLEEVVRTHYFERKFDQNMFAVGGKTGTAQIAKPGGGYEDHDYNGTYLGFVGGNTPQYVVSVRVTKPRIAGYAGSRAAQPIFGDVAHMLIDNFNVTPKSR
jgi:cell division protein FtsI/penicillin-binding protein 2